MKIFVINAGSSSLKYQVIDMTNETLLVKGNVERIGIAGSFIKQKRADGKQYEVQKDLENHSQALQMVFDAITDKEAGVIKSLDEIKAVGHRVLHGAEDFSESVIVDDEVLRLCDKNTEFGPLHMPANVGCIRSCMALMPGVPQVAVFDTTFHATMEKKAYLYAIPYDLYTNYKIRKYGFHGTSHNFISQEALKYLGNPKAKIITCHLGNGSSIAAVNAGKCVDTSMGFTPLEGLIMGTRSGNIDPAAVEFARKKMDMKAEDVVNFLNKKCGVLGVTNGKTSDFRDLIQMINDGDEQAKLALDMFALRIREYIGAYSVALGGVDAIVFAGGIGENNSLVREMVLEGTQVFGCSIDKEKNKVASTGNIEEITGKDSKVRVLIIPTNEELMIARDTLRLVSQN